MCPLPPPPSLGEQGTERLVLPGEEPLGLRRAWSDAGKDDAYRLVFKPEGRMRVYLPDGTHVVASLAPSCTAAMLVEAVRTELTVAGIVVDPTATVRLYTEQVRSR